MGKDFRRLTATKGTLWFHHTQPPINGNETKLSTHPPHSLRWSNDIAGHRYNSCVGKSCHKTDSTTAAS